MPADHYHDGVIVGWPGDEHPVLAVEGSTTDVVESATSQAITRRHTTAGSKLGQGQKGRPSPLRSQGTNLALRGGGQLELDRLFPGDGAESASGTRQ